MTSGYGRGLGEGLPLSAVKALPEGVERRRSKQVANTPPRGVSEFVTVGLRPGHVCFLKNTLRRG